MKRVMFFMFLVTCCSFHALVFGQSTTGELSTSQRKVVWKSHSSDNYGSYGLEDPGATLPIGNSSTVRFRPCFQWSIPDETLPDGCTIDSVRLQMEVGRTHSVDLWFELAKMPYNLTLSATNAEIYQAVTVPANYIIGGQQSTSIGIDLKWYGSNSAIAQAILEQLPSDRFTIGLRSQDEGVAPLYGWWIYDSFKSTLFRHSLSFFRYTPHKRFAQTRCLLPVPIKSIMTGRVQPRS